MRVFTAPAISSGSAPTTMRLWESWAMLEAIAPFFNPKPRTKPVITGASRYRSGIPRPPITLSVAVSLPVTISSRIRSITRTVTERPCAGTAKSPDTLGVTVIGYPPGAGRAEKAGRPPAARALGFGGDPEGHVPSEVLPGEHRAVAVDRLSRPVRRTDLRHHAGIGGNRPPVVHHLAERYDVSFPEPRPNARGA